MPPENWAIGLSAIVLTLLGMQAGFGAWISNQFSKVISRVDKMRDDLMNRLDYHERHDDRRFSDLGDDMWEIRLRLASSDQWLDRRKSLKQSHPSEKSAES